MASSQKYSDDQLCLAARLYYIDGMGQSEVAKFVKVSQASVSRLLALARERGIVRISVADYEPRQASLERELQIATGLNHVVAIKADPELEPSDLRLAVGHFGAPALASLIKPNMVVAVAGGRTIHETSKQLPEVRQLSLTVVQAMGSVDSNVSAIDAQEVGRMMAQRLGGSFLALNTPAYFPEKRTRDALLKLAQVSNVHETLKRADLAVVGVGTLENSVFVERGTLPGEGITALKKAGAVGEICGRFFDEDGQECDTSWKDRVMSLGLDDLKRIPQAVAIVSGSDRSLALKAAIRGKLIKALIIDEAGARALLKTLGTTEKAGKGRKAR